MSVVLEDEEAKRTLSMPMPSTGDEKSKEGSSSLPSATGGDTGETEATGRFSETDGGAYVSSEWNYDSEDSLSYDPYSDSSQHCSSSTSAAECFSDDGQSQARAAEEFASTFLPKPNILPFTKPRTIRAVEPKFPKMMMVLEDVLTEEAIQGLYRYSNSIPSSWGIYIPVDALEATHEYPEDIPDENDDWSFEAHCIKFKLSANAVKQLWVERLKPIWMMEKDNVHGFEVWCLKCEPGHHVGYHLDFAEFPFLETRVLSTPLYSSTIHISKPELMLGGVFVANVGGIDHYLKSRPLQTDLKDLPDDATNMTDAVTIAAPPAEGQPREQTPPSFESKEKLRKLQKKEHQRQVSQFEGRMTDQSFKSYGTGEWVHVAFHHNRSIIHDGRYPHFSTPVEFVYPTDEKRIIIGINVYDKITGPEIASCSVHSTNFRLKMKEREERSVNRRNERGEKAFVITVLNKTLDPYVQSNLH